MKIPSPQGDFLVVMRRTLVGILTGPLTLRCLSFAPRTRSPQTKKQWNQSWNARPRIGRMKHEKKKKKYPSRDFWRAWRKGWSLSCGSVPGILQSRAWWASSRRTPCSRPQRGREEEAACLWEWETKEWET